MQVIYCDWSLVRFISEEHLQNEDREFMKLSVTMYGDVELMIFLEKSESDSDYKVKVYKARPSDKYVPKENDNISHYEENDEYITFFFKKLDDACDFLDNLGYAHPEYKERPVRKIGKKN